MNDVNKFYDINRDTASVRGFFFIKDMNGNVISTNENMVVKSGRRLILNTLLGTEAFELSESMFFKIGSDSRLTNPDDTTLEKIYDSKTIPVTIEEHVDELYVKISGSITHNTSTDGPYVINELGLFVNMSSDDETLEDTMFSRVVFPDVYMKDGVSYTLDYYIYF